jgi:hypothetical protein
LTEATAIKKSKSSLDPGGKVSAAVVRALREGTLLVFGAVAFVLLLALLSFHTQDRGPFDTGAATTTLKKAA